MTKPIFVVFVVGQVAPEGLLPGHSWIAVYFAVRRSGLESAQRGDLFDGPQLGQGVHGCFDQGDRIIGSVRLGQNVMDAGCFAYRPHRLAGDDTGTGTGWNQ